MKDFKLSEFIILGVLIVINIFITDLPPFADVYLRIFAVFIFMFAAVVFWYGRMFKTALAFLGISLIFILLLLPNIKDFQIYFTKNYSTTYVKVESYYYSSTSKGSNRSNEYIVCKVADSEQKVTFRLPSNWWRDTNGSSDEMEGNEYKITYLPNTKQIINIEEKKQAVPDKSTSENE